LQLVVKLKGVNHVSSMHSSFGTDFNTDFGVTVGDEEKSGLSVFLRDKGNVYRTSCTPGRSRLSMARSTKK
jgi:predicted dithiol-disulfide oxidoreductase (DUF899 family)